MFAQNGETDGRQNGKTAIVLDGSRGIGEGVVKVLVREDAYVVNCESMPNSAKRWRSAVPRPAGSIDIGGEIAVHIPKECLMMPAPGERVGLDWNDRAMRCLDATR